MGQQLKTDWTLFGATIGMVAFGMVILYSASSVMAELKFGSDWHFVLRQCLWMIPSLAIMMALKRAPYRKFQNPTVAFAAIGLVLILLAGVIAAGLVVPESLGFLVGTYAFGAMLAFTIAHASVVKMRYSEPDRERPYRTPFSVRVRGGELPLLAVIGAVVCSLGWIATMVVHETARYVGLGWMAAGIALYVIYRRADETSLLRRVTVPVEALRAEHLPERDYGSILVPLCGTRLDEDIVQTAALLVAAASSTQDIVVDAFRIESLPESEQAAGMASYVAAYRVGMLVSTAGALFMVSAFEGTGIARAQAWMWGYVAMAALVLIGTVTALAATEPEQSVRADAATSTEAAFARVMHAAIGAFSEFLVRKDALAALAFVVLYKFTDAFSGTMTAPFVIDLGFSRNDYAAIVKGVGLAATLIGGFAGGFVARRYSLAASLWIGGVLQAVANLSFSWLASVGVNHWALVLAITAENFSSAIGTVIFVAYLSALCRNPLHTATQYALLTALAAVGRTYLSSGAGYVAKSTGWPLFFAICVVIAIPSLMLLAWLKRRGHFEALGPVKV